MPRPNVRITPGSRPAPTSIVLAFGSNLGDRAATIRAAVAELQHDGLVRIDAVSPLIDTVAVTTEGADPDKPAYLNAVATGHTVLEPLDLLALVNAVEAAHGRVRAERWGDRTLDIDIIDMGGQVLDLPGLELPHPRASERDFVLGPWNEIAPDAVLVGHGPVAELLAGLGGASS